MARDKIKMRPESGYAWITATVTGGKCYLTYRVIGATINGRDVIGDDHVDDWTDDDIRDVAGKLLNVPQEHRKDIEVIWD